MMKELKMGIFRKKVKSQGMVEFALILPILLLLVYGLLEVGRAVFIYSTVVTAAREAARFGSASEWNAVTRRYEGQYRNCNGILQRAQLVDFLDTFQDADVIIQFDHGPASTGTGPIAGYPAPFENCPSIDPAVHFTSGDRIVVQVSGSFTPVVPLVPLQPLTIRSVSARTILGLVVLDDD